MRKSLFLLGLAAAVAANADDIQVREFSGNVQPVHVVQRQKAPARMARPLKTLQNKQLPAVSAVNPYSRAPRREAPVLPEGYSLFESFEGWNGEGATWLPEGWTRESHNDSELSDFERWSPFQGGGFFPAAPDGNYYFAISVAMGDGTNPARPQDEWLISPAVTVKEGEQLSFQEWLSPFFCFNGEYIDWDAFEFTKKEVVQDIEVLVREEGAQEWTKIYSAIEKYLGDDYSGMDLYEVGSYFVPVAVPLDQYVGKTVNFAFRYVGCDGNTNGIDAIAVGLKPLEGIHYAEPLHTQYFGFNDGWSALNAGIAVFPVNAEIYWANASQDLEADYIWSYNDPADGNEVVGGHADGLRLTYEPDFSSDFSRINNLFYPHVLKGSKEGFTPGSYAAPYTFLQAGGAAHYQTKGDLFEGTMLPFDQINEGFTYVSVPSTAEMETPIFGYDENCDAYWYNYTFQDEQNPDYAAYVDGIINAVYPAEAPLTVYGANLLAMTKVSDPDKIAIRFRVVALDDEGVPQFDTPLAVAVATKEQMLIDSNDTNLHMTTFPVTFDKPVVLDNSNLGYIIVVDGYRNAGFEYFAPMQSALPHPEQYALGYVMKYSTLSGESGLRAGLLPIAYIDGENGPCFNTFAIGLDAEYGYLGLIDTDPVVLNKDDHSKTVRFHTFTKPERLVIDAPEGIIASVEGRFDQAVLTIAKDDTKDVDGVVTLSDNARTVSIPVKAFAGIADIEADADATVTAVYTLAGVEVSPVNLPAGVYLRRYSNGKVEKITID